MNRHSIQPILRSMKASGALVFACTCLWSAEFSVDHEAKIGIDLGGERVARWSSGGLQAFQSNQTAAPLLISFDDTGKQSWAHNFSIPGAEVIDIADFSRGAGGNFAVCGSAFDHAGRGSGFFSIINPSGETSLIVRTDPYTPFLVALAPDSTIWTVGMELSNRSETGPGIDANAGVLRHFDINGKQIASFIPRSTVGEAGQITWGFLRATGDRVGWCTGPVLGPGSVYFEVSSAGTVRKFPAISLGERAAITGFALTDDGKAFITTFDNRSHASQLLSLNDPDPSWEVKSLPDPLSTSRRVILYGGDADRLVFSRSDRFTLTFIRRN